MEQFQLGNSGLDPLIRTENDRVLGRFGHLNKLVNAITALQEVPPGSGLQSVVAGTNITVDDSDPLNPIINSDGAVGNYLPLAGGTMDEEATITLAYPNGDDIILGATYDRYSAISFSSRSAGNIKLYVRGGDLFLINENTDEGVDGLIGTINGLSQNKVNFIGNFNTASQGAYGTSNYLYLGENGKQYLDNGVDSHLGYTKLPSHYFIDSCSYTQSGTSAPTVLTTFETQVGDFASSGVESKSIDYIAVGHYRISYQASYSLGFDPYLPTDLNKVKVILSPGKVPLTILSYDVNFTALGRLSVDIFVRQSTTGNLVNSFLDGSVVDVYFYM